MASPVDALIAEINALLPGSWTQATGDVNIPQHDAPPRIVWVRPDNADAWGPAGKHRRGSPGALWTRGVALEAHLWAVDYDALETPSTGMIDRVVQAVHSLCVGEYGIAGGGTVSETPNLEHGVAYVIRFVVNFPVVRAIETSATIDTVDVQMQTTDGTTTTDGPTFTVTT